MTTASENEIPEPGDGATDADFARWQLARSTSSSAPAESWPSGRTVSTATA
jgi:hypothetical protein